MNCPNCNQKSKFQSQYKFYVCINKQCNLYLKDDLSKHQNLKSNNTESLINEVMNEFDFDKVHKVMQFLNWTWRDEGVPSIFDLKQTARMQMDECVKSGLNQKQDFFYQSGGFKVNYYFNENILELSFVLTDWSAE